MLNAFKEGLIPLDEICGSSINQSNDCGYVNTASGYFTLLRKVTLEDETILCFIFTFDDFEHGEFSVQVLGISMPVDAPEPGECEEEECYKGRFNKFTFIGEDIFAFFLELLHSKVKNTDNNAGSPADASAESAEEACNEEFAERDNVASPNENPGDMHGPCNPVRDGSLDGFNLFD